MITSEEAGFLARIIAGGVLGSAAVWVAFGPELKRILARGWRADVRSALRDATDGGTDTEAA